MRALDAIWHDLQRKFRRARDQFRTFVAFPGAVEVTNNACERALRSAVVRRKVTNGYRAMWVAGAQAAIRTVVDTAPLTSGASPFTTSSKPCTPDQRHRP
jgi:transposase